MKSTDAAQSLDDLRAALDDDERHLLHVLWRYRQKQNKWMPTRTLHHDLTASKTRAVVQRLGGSIVQHHRASGSDPERYELTTLGIFLTEEGKALEASLARYLEYWVERFQSDADAMVADESSLAAKLSAGELRQLPILLQDYGSTAYYPWAGGVSVNPSGWQVRVPERIDELAELPDLKRYVHEQVFAHFDPNYPADGDARMTYQQATRQRGPDALPFLPDKPLKRQLASDLREVEIVHAAGAWKSCVILCGGIIEGLVYSELVRIRKKVKNTKAAVGQGALEKWTLDPLLAAAEELHIFGPATLRVSDAVRHYRNLIHPARQVSVGITIDKSQAEIARGAVSETLREILARRRSIAKAAAKASKP